VRRSPPRRRPLREREDSSPSNSGADASTGASTGRAFWRLWPPWPAEDWLFWRLWAPWPPELPWPPWPPRPRPPRRRRLPPWMLPALDAGVDCSRGAAVPGRVSPIWGAGRVSPIRGLTG